MKGRVSVQEVRAARGQPDSSSGRSTTHRTLFPRTQTLKSTPPMANVLSRPSTFPAFAELRVTKLTPYSGLRSDGVSRRKNEGKLRLCGVGGGRQGRSQAPPR